jgi:periplasmic protein TonB
MRYILSIFLFICFETSYAQTATAENLKSDATFVGKKTDSAVYLSSKKNAEFPGGKTGWQKFMSRNLHWPGPDDSPEAGNVIISFTVMADGSLSDIKVVGEPAGLVRAATNLIKRSPKWIPAEEDGRKVAAHITQPINSSVMSY